MADRPYIDFQEVKEKVPIPEALEALGVAEKFTRKGDVLTGQCPIPMHKHGPRPNREQFKVHRRDETWLYKCFGDCCNESYGGGDVIALVKAVTGHDNAHVRFWFAEHFGDRLSQAKRRAKRELENQGVVTSATGAEWKAIKQQTIDPQPLKFYLNVNTKSALPYLEGRGISQETAERFGVGIAPKGVLKDYLAMPVYRCPRATPDEYPCGYVGRWPGDDFDADAGRPRYKVPEGFETSQFVFGLEEALHAGTDSTPLIVVEGPLKAIWLADRGFTNTVSSFTASVSDEQARLLRKTKRPVVLAFDGNQAGFQGMRTAAGRLIADCFVRVVKLPEGKEPDQLNADELSEFFGFCRPQP